VLLATHTGTAWLPPPPGGAGPGSYGSTPPAVASGSVPGAGGAMPVAGGAMPGAGGGVGNGVSEGNLTSAVLGAVVGTSVSGLSVLGAGSAGPPAAELYGSPALTHVLGRLQERFAVTVIDGPPVLESSDARLLARAADGIVLVVAERRGRIGQAREALQLLAGTSTPVVGVVLDHIGRTRLWPSARSSRPVVSASVGRPADSRSRGRRQRAGAET